MRIRKRSIRARVKGDLSISFTQEALSAHGGLELIRRFLDRSGFVERLRKLYSIRQFDFGHDADRLVSDGSPADVQSAEDDDDFVNGSLYRDVAA